MRSCSSPVKPGSARPAWRVRFGQDVHDELVVTWGTCLPDQGAPPFLPWRPLVAPEPSRPSAATDDSVGAPRYEQLVAMRDQLRDLARSHARLHVIEDLQWADVASLLLLSQLGAGIDDLPLLVVATLRTDEPRSHQLDDAIEEVRRVSRVRELPPLDDDDIATLVRRTGTEADPLLIAVIGARTGATRFLVSDSCAPFRPASPTNDACSSWPSTCPNRVSDLVLNRLGRMPGQVTDALVTASVLGSEGDTVDAGGGRRHRRRSDARSARPGPRCALPRCRALRPVAVPPPADT